MGQAEVYNLLKSNKDITTKEIALKLNVQTNSVNVCLSKLIKQKLIYRLETFGKCRKCVYGVRK